MLTGSGDIYDAVTLRLNATLPRQVRDAYWGPRGIYTLDDDGVTLRHWGGGGSNLQQSKIAPGSVAAGLFHWNGYLYTFSNPLQSFAIEDDGSLTPAPPIAETPGTASP